MKRLLIAALIAGSAGATSQVVLARQGTVDPSRFARIDEVINADIKDKKLPGAVLLLREEHPLSIPYTEKKEDHYLFTGPVASFEGVGRFVLGLIDEIQVIGNPSFREYVQHKLTSPWKG